MSANYESKVTKKKKDKEKSERGNTRRTETGRGRGRTSSTLFHFNAPRSLKRSASSKWAASRGHGRANIERGGGDGSSDASFIRQAWASASCVDKEVMCTRSFLFSPRSYTPRAGLNYRNGIYKEYLRYNSGV